MHTMKRFLSMLLIGAILCFSVALAEGAGTEPEQYDIVIIGAGAAGMSAAITAYDEGDHNIVVQETQAYAGGGSAKAYGGIYSSAVSYETDPSEDGNNETTVEQLYEAGMEASAGADKDVQHLYAEHAHETLEWLNDLGYRWGTIHYDNLYRPSDGSGVGDQLTQALLEQITTRNIEVRYNTTAVRILKDDDGIITGVLAENQNLGEYEIRTGCVILATGGYANNQEMLAAYNSGFVSIQSPPGMTPSVSLRLPAPSEREPERGPKSLPL